jgi:TolB-like protein/class 3 adenylate cyclase/Flp pilus assembly protein TadD
MTTPSRRLTAVVFTDIVGYSAVVHRDEALGALLLDRQRAVVRRFVPKYGGREVETAGDGFLLEFGSALAAVQAVIAIQQELARDNSRQPAHAAVVLRASVHLGDVEHRGREIYGDGVNTAARLLPHSPAGGLACSAPVLGMVRQRLALPASSIGTPPLKNIASPVEIFVVESAAIGEMEVSQPRAPSGRIGLRRIAVAAALGLGLIVAVIGAWLGRGSGTAGPGARSVAVLPFVDMSQGKDQEYFSDGLSEQLLNALAQLPELHVAGRTSSFHFKGRNEDLREIGRKLNVATVLEGSVAKSGETLRITAQLINAENGYHLWSQTYDRKLIDVFALQDEIVKNVVAALKLKLLPEQVPVATRSSSAEAYNEYLLGLDFLRQGSVDGWKLAVEAFGRSVALDSGFAPAWAGLAEAEYEVAYYNVDATAVIAAQARALQHAEKAVASAPELAAGYRARAKLRSEATFDHSGALADLFRALEINAGDSATQQRLGDMFTRLGRFTEAQAALGKALELDPLSPRALADMAELHKLSGRWDEAAVFYQRALQLAPESAYAISGLGQTYLLQGKLPLALETNRRQRDDARRLYVTALIEHSQRNPAKANLALDELIQRFGAGWAYQIGVVYAWRGEKDKAFAWLDRAHLQQDGGMVWLKTEPMLESLRADPRFPSLLRKVGLAA